MSTILWCVPVENRKRIDSINEFCYANYTTRNIPTSLSQLDLISFQFLVCLFRLAIRSNGVKTMMR